MMLEQPKILTHLPRPIFTSAKLSRANQVHIVYQTFAVKFKSQSSYKLQPKSFNTQADNTWRKNSTA